MIAILNHGAGNIQSIYSMHKRLGIPAVITADIDEIEKADRLILPGVGHFDHCMNCLTNASFYDHLHKWVHVDKKPILGVCVGLQMFFESSEEGGRAGLGWIAGKNVKFQKDKFVEALRIPHMGWNYLEPKNENRLLEGLEKSKFYFVHSFHALPTDEQVIIGTTQYGYQFAAAVNQDNIYGVQFHPEKSHKYGMRLLENFSKIYPC